MPTPFCVCTSSACATRTPRQASGSSSSSADRIAQTTQTGGSQQASKSAQGWARLELDAQLLELSLVAPHGRRPPDLLVEQRHSAICKVHMDNLRTGRAALLSCRLGATSHTGYCRCVLVRFKMVRGGPFAVSWRPRRDPSMSTLGSGAGRSRGSAAGREVLRGVPRRA